MDKYDRSLREDHYSYRRERESPSFSSTLLDAIYRSIDEAAGSNGEPKELVFYSETMRKKRSNCATAKANSGGGFDGDEVTASRRQACMVEKWMEKKVNETVVLRRAPVEGFETKPRMRRDLDSVFLNCSSSSSDSFSSSEAESVYAAHRPKPIRTSVSSAQPEKLEVLVDKRHHEKSHSSTHQKQNHENGFVKTKSRAMKIYGDFKKAKQPISPGSRLASFLNSLMNKSKKAKISSSTGGYDDPCSETKSKSAQSSTCSSASSFSRSCLSKTPSSRGKLSHGTKRSVTFHPFSVIVDEDAQPCGKKLLYKDEASLEVMRRTLRESISEELKLQISERNRRVEEAARNLLKQYEKKVDSDFGMQDVRQNDEGESEDDDYEDDAASCTSSDLFELDNLSVIGIERYCEELPVYETTNLDTNRAIADGLIR
ncbi:hypothetical protein NMG60_11004078 [Bertholletia excelsa]